MPRKKRRNSKRGVMDGRKLKAAQLLALGDKTIEEIADIIGVHRTTLGAWQQDPIFRAKMSEFYDAEQRRLEEAGIRERVNRVKWYDDNRRLMQQVIDARSRYTNGIVELEPGWDTGLLVRKEMTRGQQTTIEYAVDTPLLQEFRNTLKQAAQELGQWSEKQDTTLNAGESFIDALREFGRGQKDAS